MDPSIEMDVEVARSELTQHDLNDVELKELARISWSTCDDGNQPYSKGLLWSPDGNLVLTAVNGQGLKLVELPPDLQNSADTPVSLKRPLDILDTHSEIRESGTVYDYCWLKGGHSPHTLLTTVQHEPIKLYSISGQLLSSYRGYDDVDEVENALSVTTSEDGSSIFGGYKKNIKIFDTERPGRDYRTVVTKCPISTIAERGNLVVAGSWNKNVVLFDDRTPAESLSCFMGHTGGITMVKFATDSSYILIGARKNHCLLKWDLRNLSVTAVLYQRYVDTNQRIQFDVSPDDKYIISGDTTGILHLWDFADETDSSVKFPLHHDCCNGAAFQPTLPIIATASGQFHCAEVVDVSGDGGTVEEEIVVENSLNLWYLYK